MATKTKVKSGGIVLNASELRSALAAVKDAVPTSTPKPILRNVRIGDGLVSATDFEMRIDAAIDYHGDPILLPYGRLSAILKEAVGDEVTIEPSGSSCTVRIGRGEWRLPTEDAAEFPTWEPEKTSLVCRLASDQFSRAVSSVAYAVDNDSSRYALGALLFEVNRNESKVRFVATDGRRISVATMELGAVQDPDDSTSLAIPKAALAASRLAPKNTQVEVLRNEKEVVFNLEGATIIARQIEGRFPKWRDVFSERPNATTHEVSLHDLGRVTRAASIVTSEQSKGVTYTFANSALTLTAQSAEVGTSKVVCDVARYGRDASVKLDPRFVSQMCGVLLGLEGASVISVSLDTPRDSVLFSYGEDGEYMAVIMPLDTEV